MQAPDWYAEWRHEAVHELMAKQERLKEVYRTGSCPRYDYDLDAQTLTFSEEGVAKVVAEIQVVGTTGPKNRLWSWANDHWPEAACADLRRVRTFGAEHGIEKLTSEYLGNEDLNGLGWETTTVAARILGACGAYRPPDENGALFLVYRSIEFVS